jgi:hypothetical protein
LDGGDEMMKMSASVGMKIRESSMNVGFEPKRKGPHKMREIVNNNEIIFHVGIA